MAEANYTYTITRKDLLAVYWPLARNALREEGLQRSPRAWAYVLWGWLRLRTGL